MLCSDLVLAISVLSMATAAPLNISGLAQSISNKVSSAKAFIGQGMPTVAIKAKGFASSRAWKGFPNNDVANYTEDHDWAVAHAQENYGVIPRGINPVNCTIKEGQRPVILIPGTGEQVYDNWAYMGPKLVTEEGLCVYSFTHNPSINRITHLFGGGTDDAKSFYGDITASATALSTFVDQVLEITGQSEVDFIGHSQGAGALPYYYLKRLGGASKVRKTIGIAPSLGTNGKNLQEYWGVELQRWGVSGYFSYVYMKLTNSQGTIQQLYDSPFMIDLHKGGVGVPGVEYFNIATKADNLLLPYTRCRFDATPGVVVTNVVLQDFCPEDYSDHHHVSYSGNVYQLVKNYLLGVQFDNITCVAPPKGATVRPDPYPVIDTPPDMSYYT